MPHFEFDNVMKEKVTKIQKGVLYYTRKDESAEFYCERCNSKKISKISVKFIDNLGNESLICNGCYGKLLSEKKVD